MEDKTPKAEYPVGILTTQNRDVWAKQRIYLEENGNQETLKKIDSAIFNIVLDDETIDDNKHKILTNYLHGDGLNRSLLFFILIKYSYICPCNLEFKKNM